MPTQDEKNLALCKFMGWTRDCSQPYCEGHDGDFNFYADTPEAYWRTKLLKDEFVRRTGRWIRIDLACGYYHQIYFRVKIKDCLGEDNDGVIAREIESHAILDAIYEAIK